MDSSDLFREEYTIDTPENVTFGYEVAGIGNRFVAALVDTLILGLLLVLLNILIFVMVSVIEDSGVPFGIDEPSWIGGVLIALYALINFTIIWGYYMLFELLWNGQSPGKRVAKIRVVRVEGVPAGFIEIAIRNLVRVIDFLPFGYGVGLVTMFLNRRSRRLGDFAANTLVIKDRGELSLDSLTALSSFPDPVDVPNTALPPPAEAISSATNQTSEQSVPNKSEVAYSDIGGSAIDNADGTDDLVEDSVVEPAAQRAESSLAAEVDSAVPHETQPGEFPAIHRLSRDEYELIVEALARHDSGNLDLSLINRLAAMTATRLNLPVPRQNGADSREFLSRVSRAYRQQSH